jgi:hypothetical protein
MLQLCGSTNATATVGNACVDDPVGRIFPDDNPWNADISTLPVLNNSGNMVAGIGPTASLHPDFGTLFSGVPWGIPFIVAKGSQPFVTVDFTAYSDESDPGPYPVPVTAPIEGGSASTGDRHVIAFDARNRLIYELYRAFPQSNTWTAASGSIFDSTTNKQRPIGWTSADAAGLPILPGLARYEEVKCGAIRHALRFTVQRTRRAYIYPASHFASTNTNPDLPAMGQRFRLKASFDVSKLSPQSMVVAQALKTYGMIVADNGSNWFLSGAPNANWNDNDINDLKQIHGSDFEAVDTSNLHPPSDTSSPSPPGNLRFSQATASQITVSWDAATDNTGVTGYRVTVSPNADFSNPLPTYTSQYVGNILSTNITGVNPSTRYYVQVTAYDEAGNVSKPVTGSFLTAASSRGTGTLPHGFSSTNGASFAIDAIAPGSLVTAFVPSSGVAQECFDHAVPLRNMIGGVMLNVGGTLVLDAASQWNYSPVGQVTCPLNTWDQNGRELPRRLN